MSLNQVDVAAAAEVEDGRLRHQDTLSANQPGGGRCRAQTELTASLRPTVQHEVKGHQATSDSWPTSHTAAVSGDSKVTGRSQKTLITVSLD